MISYAQIGWSSKLFHLEGRSGMILPNRKEVKIIMFYWCSKRLMSSYFLSLLHVYSTYSTVHDACFSYIHQDISTLCGYFYMWVGSLMAEPPRYGLRSCASWLRKMEKENASWKRKSLLEEEYGMDSTFIIYIYMYIHVYWYLHICRTKTKYETQID